MSRDVPFDKDAICDGCGAKGAFDFMGDYLCVDCMPQFEDDDDEEAPCVEEDT